MAIALSNIAGMTGGNVANATSYVTGAGVLTAGRKYLIRIANYATGGGADPTSVVHDAAGTPLSFTKVTDGTTAASKNNYDSAAHRGESVWQVTPSATTASAGITITFGATRSSCGWSVDEITGHDETGTFVQVVVNSGTAGTAIAATMAAFGATGNLTYLAMAWGSGTANPTQTISPTESRSELEEHNDGERSSLGCHYQNPNGGDTTVGATLSAATDWAIIAIEIKAAAGGGGATGSGAMSAALGSSMSAAGDEKFSGTGALSVTAGAGMTAVGDLKFTGSGAMTATLGSSMAAVGDLKFSGTGALAELLPATMTGSGTSGAAPPPPPAWDGRSPYGPSKKDVERILRWLAQQKRKNRDPEIDRLEAVIRSLEAQIAEQDQQIRIASAHIRALETEVEDLETLLVQQFTGE